MGETHFAPRQHKMRAIRLEMGLVFQSTVMNLHTILHCQKLMGKEMTDVRVEYEGMNVRIHRSS